MTQLFPLETVVMMKTASYEEGVQFGISSILEAAEFDSIEELLAFVGKHRKVKRTKKIPQESVVIQDEG